MKNLLALALSIAVDTFVFACVHKLSTSELPRGEVFITELAAPAPAVAELKLRRWRRDASV